MTEQHIGNASVFHDTKKNVPWRILAERFYMIGRNSYHIKTGDTHARHECLPLKMLFHAAR